MPSKAFIKHQIKRKHLVTKKKKHLFLLYVNEQELAFNKKEIYEREWLIKRKTFSSSFFHFLNKKKASWLIENSFWPVKGKLVLNFSYHAWDVTYEENYLSKTKAAHTNVMQVFYWEHAYWSGAWLDAERRIQLVIFLLKCIIIFASTFLWVLMDLYFHPFVK